MKKFLVLLGMPRCATSWLNQQIISQPGVNVMPRKEINYFMRQYGASNRLSDGIRFKQFQAYVAAQKLGLKKGAKSIQKERGGRLEEPGMLAGADPDPQGLWAKGGNYRKSHRKLKTGLNWYMRYTSGPIDDEWYRALHKDAGEDEWCVDFSTTNGMVNDEGFAKMAGFAETTKAILILRHPLDRLWSHVRLMAEKSGQAEGKRLAKWSDTKVKAFVEERPVLDRSLYAPVVKGMVTHFTPENRMILNYEDIAVNPRGIVEDIAKFLDVTPNEKVLENLAPREGAQKGVRVEHPQLAQFAAPCLDHLREVSAMGIDMVDPWIEDLEKIAKG